MKKHNFKLRIKNGKRVDKLIKKHAYDYKLNDSHLVCNTYESFIYKYPKMYYCIQYSKLNTFPMLNLDLEKPVKNLRHKITKWFSDISSGVVSVQNYDYFKTKDYHIIPDTRLIDIFINNVENYFNPESKELIMKALKMAYYSHKGQTDKIGKQYILHPVYVANNLIKPKNEDIDKNNVIVALLHDTVEDTELTLDEIESEFGKIVSEAVDCITHRVKEPREDYYQRVLTNPIALSVKKEDIKHNVSRLDQLRYLIHDRERLVLKYEKAMGCLGMTQDENT